MKTHLYLKILIIILLTGCRPEIDEIIKANKIFLSLLIVDGELSQIGDNDSGRLFYFSFAQAKAFKVGLHVRGYGVIRTNGSLLQVFHPSYKIFASSKRPALDNTLTPIYSLGSSKMTQFRARNIIKECLKEIEELNLNEKEIDSIFKQKKISSLSVKDALLKIHSPSVDDDITKINSYKHEAKNV